MLKKTLRTAGFCFLFLCIGLVAFVTNFPVGRLIDNYLSTINQNLGGYKVGFRSANMGLTGLTVEGVTIDSQDDTFGLTLNSVGISLLNPKLLAGKIPVTAEIYQGKVDAGFNLFSNVIDFMVRDINVTANPFIAQNNLFVSKPAINLNGNYNLDSGAFEISSKLGNIIINGQNGLIPVEFRALVPQNLKFRDVTGQAVSDGSRTNINYQFTGDFNGRVSGQIILRGSAPQMNITVTGVFDEAFSEDNAKIVDLLRLGYMDGDQLNVNIAGSIGNLNVSKL